MVTACVCVCVQRIVITISPRINLLFCMHETVVLSLNLLYAWDYRVYKCIYDLRENLSTRPN